MLDGISSFKMFDLTVLYLLTLLFMAQTGPKKTHLFTTILLSSSIDNFSNTAFVQRIEYRAST